ncbi:hypothetical protein H4R20_002190 [Coemansia guatemalensis]|uniref:Uncharacterized protein n=1 Tax=Coemansia guatemalensis TaxID=2761395 RepID=A0A9W8LTU2_9FUNG|nr:hypothetical protein H4R20_002190 [Coemansia guatemalensis]
MSAINLAGLLIYRISPRKPIEYLLLNDSLDNHRHWYPPKGKRIGSEDELKCALRETLDLTGLGANDLVADSAFRAELKYVDGIKPKQVVYFLARLAVPSRHNIIRSDGVGMKHQWCTLDQALEKAVFQSMQNILTLAEGYIEDMRDKILASSGGHGRGRWQQGTADDNSREMRGNGTHPHPRQQDRAENGGLSNGEEARENGWRPARADMTRVEDRFQKMSMYDASTQRGSSRGAGDRPPPLSPSQWRDGADGAGQPLRRPQDNPRYKTKLCEKFEQDGECPYNHKCVFAHGRDELRVREPASARSYDDQTREQPISPYQRSQPPSAGLRYNANPLYKTRLCQRFAEQGECPYFEKCQFAHGEAELRVPPEPQPRTPRDSQSPLRTPASAEQPVAGLGRGNGGHAQMWRRGQLEPENAHAPRLVKNISWSNTGARLVSESPGLDDDSVAESPTFQLPPSQPPDVDYSASSEARALHAAPLATPMPQRIPVPSNSRANANARPVSATAHNGNDSSNGAANAAKRSQHETRPNAIKGSKNGEKPWIKVVEVTDRDLKQMGSPLADNSSDAAQQKLAKAAELESRLAKELADTLARGNGAGKELTQHATLKEITHLEFRNNLTKQQLLNIVIPTLFASSVATGVADAIARNAELMSKIVSKQQDQALMLNAWQQLLAEGKNATLWQRKASELLGALYNESLLDEEVFLQWFSKKNSEDCGPEILSMKPFAHWLATAEEE